MTLTFLHRTHINIRDITYFITHFVSPGADGVKVESQMVYSDDDLAQIVEGALDQADKDNDGFITYAEFRAVASPH